MVIMKQGHNATLTQVTHVLVIRSINCTNSVNFMRKTALRFASTTGQISTTSSHRTKAISQPVESNTLALPHGFAETTTSSLIRGVILGQILRTPTLLRPSLWALEKVGHTKAAFWNADQNPLLRMLIYPLVYKHFCAGRNKAEVHSTVADIKEIGYSGVILCYSKEVMARLDESSQQVVDDASDDRTLQDIEDWKQGNLLTLSTVDPGDYIGVKLTGAGPTVSRALKSNIQTPPAVLSALHAICSQALSENKRLWIDAEQQIYHPGIDNWAMSLMRTYNLPNRVLVLTTIQAYLKSSRSTVTRYLHDARSANYALGIKLVRGAYIASDVRTNIHDTKQDTDASYDGIAHDLLSREWPELEKTSDSDSGNHDRKETFPPVSLFLTGHNTLSIRTASQLARDLAAKGELAEPVCYAQLQGMADDVGRELMAARELGGGDKAEEGGQQGLEDVGVGVPRVYKCLTWGSVHACLHYLVRRAVENRGAVEGSGIGTTQGLKDMRKELRRRILGF